MTGTARNALAVLLAGLLVVTLAWAAAADQEPDGDVATQWNDGTGFTFAEINEGADTHNSDSDYIAETGVAGTSTFTTTDVPGDFGSVNTVTLKIAHRAHTFDDDTDFFTASILSGGSLQGSAKVVTRHDSGTYTVDTFTDSAWDTMDEAALNDMDIRVIYTKQSTGMPDTGRQIRITAMTVTLDYNVAAPPTRSRVVDIQ